IDDLFEVKKSFIQKNIELEDLENKKENLENKLLSLKDEIDNLDKELHFKIKDTNIEKNTQVLEELSQIRELASEELTELKVKNKMKELLKSQTNTFTSEVEDLEVELEDFYIEIKDLKKELNENEVILKSLESFLENKNLDSVKEEIEKINMRSKNIPNELDKCSLEIGKLTNKKQTSIFEKEKFILLKEEAELKFKGAKKNYEDELALGYIIQSEIENYKGDVSAKKIEILLSELINKNSNTLSEYKIKSKFIFSDNPESERVDYTFTANRVEKPLFSLNEYLKEQIEELELLITDRDRKIFEGILLENLSHKILAIISNSKLWIKEINELMNNMKPSSSLKLDLRWEPKKAESEDELGTVQVINLLNSKDLLSEDEKQKFREHFLFKIKKVVNSSVDIGGDKSYYSVIKEVLDFRKWYKFTLFYAKNNEKRKEMTDNNFYQLSGGEKAISMYLPLLAALYVRYKRSSQVAPRIVAMDEAFAGVDEKNIGMLFAHLENLELDYILNSQVLWGDYETVPNLAICEILRESNDEIVALINYKWNGKKIE
ncbi:MAG: SbcC/MukB-like Walker B domain-containing protein, partial [Paraclostridium sp.]